MFGPILKASMVGFTLLSRSYYYLRRRSPGPPFPPDHRQAGERGAKIKFISPHRFPPDAFYNSIPNLSPVVHKPGPLSYGSVRFIQHLLKITLRLTFGRFATQ